MSNEELKILVVGLNDEERQNLLKILITETNSDLIDEVLSDAGYEPV